MRDRKRFVVYNRGNSEMEVGGMIAFLTSSHNIEGQPDLNPANGFAAELLKAVPRPCRGLVICSDPDNYERTDFYCGSVRKGFEISGVVFADYQILDRRNQNRAAELVQSADMIILMGGHVPTQNRFFVEIQLRELLKGYDGVIVGISAGSMNSADVVYAQPELEGEAISSDYQRFLPGLNLTKTMLLPHYQKVKGDMLDGMRLFEDITFADSIDRKFYVLPDGSYLYLHDGREELRGEAWLIENGVMRKISEDGDVSVL